MPDLEAALQIAAKEHDVRHVREDAGPNRDKAGRIALYLKACGIHSPAPWCAAWVSWSLLQAGYRRQDLPKNPASACSWQSWANGLGLLSADPSVALRGDLFVWCDIGKWRGHIGWIVEARKIGPWWWVRTLEGNSSEGGSREGTRIVRRGLQGKLAPLGWRRWTARMRVIRLRGWTP